VSVVLYEGAGDNSHVQEPDRISSERLPVTIFSFASLDIKMQLSGVLTCIYGLTGRNGSQKVALRLSKAACTIGTTKGLPPTLRKTKGQSVIFTCKVI
jgi:hypothetical protein